MRIALANRKLLLRCNLPAFCDDLFGQFCIRWIGDVLFLYGGIYTHFIIMALFTVNPYTFLQNQFNSFFPDTVSKMYQPRGLPGHTTNKNRFPTKILVIIVLTLLFHHALIGNVTDMFQHQQTRH